MPEIARNLRQAFRQLRKNPGFAVIAIVMFGLKFYDPLSIGAAILAMTVVAIVAGYLPARRAAKVDPMVALRYE